MMPSSFAIRTVLAIVVATLGFAAPPAQGGSVLTAARAAVAKRAIKPKPQPASVQPEDKPRDVIIRRKEHPQAAANIENAQRTGQPTVLHIDRAGAGARRRASTGSVSLKNKPAPGYERDEYPPAMTREGGRNANVRYIDPHDNRGAGARIRAQTRDLPDGAKIRVLVAD